MTSFTQYSRGPLGRVILVLGSICAGVGGWLFLVRAFIWQQRGSLS